MSGEKTESPTQKKIRDARKKGDVAHSKDFSQTILLMVLLGYMWVNGQGIKEGIIRIILAPAELVDAQFETAWLIVSQTILQEAVSISIPFLLIVLVFGAFGHLIQTGLILAFEKLKPSGKKLNVIANIKNIFSKKNLAEFLKSVVKISLLFTLLFLVIRDTLPELIKIPYTGVSGVESAISSLLKVLVINIGLGYAVIAIADLAWQRRQYHKDLMMTKHEVKQEYKQMEGDPYIKGKRRQLHQEMAMQASVVQTRKASVLVVNPTHYAVALYYEEEETPLPLVLAMGEGELANQMIQAAREEGIPIMRNVPLARSLTELGQVDQYIPDELIVPVAEVLKLVQEMQDNNNDWYEV